MQRVFNWIVDHPRSCAFLALLIPLCFSAGLPRLEIDASTRSLFPVNEPDVEYYRNVRANFGSDSLITVVVRANDMFQPEVLRTIRDLAVELDDVENVRSVLSLFSLKVPHWVKDNFRVEPLISKIPDDPATLEGLRTDALAHPVIPGLILNEDATASALHVLLRTERGDPEPGREERLVAAIEARIETARQSAGSGIEIYSIGAPVIKTFASRYIWHDLIVLGPIALLVIGGVIFLFYRSALATFLPLITGCLSVLATLGFMGLAGFAVNPFASVIVVLILVMGCTEDLHIMAEYALGIRKGLTKKDAIRALGRAVVSALFLTSITTFLGFLSIAPNPISGLREFAIACAAGIFLNFLITLLLVPSLLRFLPPPRAFARGEAPLLGRLRGAVNHLICRRPGRIALLSLAVIIAAGVGASRLQIDTSYIRFFPEDSEIGRGYAQFSRDFGGASSFMVTVETGRENGVYDLETFDDIARLNDHLKDRFQHAAGFVDFFRDFKDKYSSGNSGRRRQFSAEEEIGMFRLVLGEKYLSPFVDYDGSRTAIRIRSFIPGSKGMRKTETEILQFARDNLPADLEVRVTGERVLTARFSDRVTRQLVQNLLILSAVVTLLLILFFRSVKLGLLAIVPNLFPVMTTFGYMGWAGIPLSTGTFAVAIVALGIAVDDTIHFMTRFFHESKSGVSANEAISNSLSKELQPVLSTSVALTLGYLVLLFSPFLIHRETGLLFAIAITTACFADLFVTPVLLRFFSRPEKKIFGATPAVKGCE